VGINSWRVTSIRLTPVPTAEHGSERGGGVRVPRVTGVGSSLGANVLTGLNLTLQPNVARDPGDEQQQRLRIQRLLQSYHGITRDTAKRP
jgi:hypothetical protein